MSPTVSQMKTFQVINVRWFNATSWYAMYLGKLLGDAGHETLVITLAGTDSERKALEMGLKTETLDLNTINPFRLLPAAMKAIRLIKRHRPDVINCHRGEGFLLWGLFKLLGFKYKLVRTRGDQRLPKNNLPNRLLHSRLADAVVATNKRMADHFLKTMNTPEDKLWLIHGGVDMAAHSFDPEGRDRVRKEFGFAPEHFVVGLLGRFDRVKGQLELIQAVSRLYHEKGMKSLRLFFIGFETATRLDQVQEWIDEYDLREIACISGRRDDVAACVSAVDLGVVASLWSEAIARAALEIMAAKRPLISTDVGVMPDLVPGTALVPPGDMNALAQMISAYAENENLRKKLVREQQTTMSQLSGHDFLKRTLTLYQGLQDG